ncbi:MAG: ABC transporter substrate-binding protein [Eubacteriales bacterium]|nr:ABC transporter substrate-binding protein [Eubacteriales bacterium]
MVPCLATEWEMTDPNGLEYTIKLRDDVVFHDGSTMTADDVVFSFMRFVDENHAYAGTGPFPNASVFFSPVKEVVAVDDTTVKFIMDEPCAPFLSYLTMSVASIVNADVIMANADNSALVDSGSGPYQLVSWEKGVSLNLTRFDGYWGETAKTKDVVIEPVVEPLVRVTKLQNGEADIVVDVDPDAIAELEADNFIVNQAVTSHYWYVVLNNSQAPFDNKLVRQAVNYAIDKESIVNDILVGTGTVATQPLSPVIGGYNPDLEGYAYDPVKAKELLAQAGYENGFTVNFLIPESGSGMQSCVAMCTAIQGYLADVGITCNIEKMEWGTFLNTCFSEDLHNGDAAYNMWALSMMNVTGDPDAMIARLFANYRIPRNNSAAYNNEELSARIKAASQMTDTEARMAEYQAISAVIVEDAPHIFVDWGNQIVGTGATVEGLKLVPSQKLNLADVVKK